MDGSMYDVAVLFYCTALCTDCRSVLRTIPRIGLRMALGTLLEIVCR